MSHLSKIQTKIHKVSTLQKTLDDLGFQYRIQFNTQQEKKTIVLHTKYTPLSFEWNGAEYSLVTDLQAWNHDITIDTLINKITQQYSYNSILEESIKYGFTSINKETMQDGSIKLTVQRWD